MNSKFRILMSEPMLLINAYFVSYFCDRIIEKLCMSTTVHIFDNMIMYSFQLYAWDMILCDLLNQCTKTTQSRKSHHCYKTGRKSTISWKVCIPLYTINITQSKHHLAFTGEGYNITITEKIVLSNKSSVRDPVPISQNHPQRNTAKIFGIHISICQIMSLRSYFTIS